MFLSLFRSKNANKSIADSFQSTKSWLSKRWGKKNANKDSKPSVKNLDADGHFEDENMNDTTMIPNDEKKQPR